MLRFLLKTAIRSAVRASRASYNTPERIGEMGERQVNNALTSVLDASEYQVLSDLILPRAGGTTQLDHLVLSRYGIFVIETKNMSGWIFGGRDQKKWTQVLKGGKRRSFQNPLRQNFAHVKAVQEILSVEEDILHNFVVFIGAAEPKTDMPENVAWGLKALGRLIGARRQIVLSGDQVIRFAEKLQKQALEDSVAVRELHLQNLDRNAQARNSAPTTRLVAHPNTVSCPRCGNEMVKRTNRKSGDVFWGCSDFPKCRGTRKSA